MAEFVAILAILIVPVMIFKTSVAPVVVAAPAAGFGKIILGVAFFVGTVFGAFLSWLRPKPLRGNTDSNRRRQKSTGASAHTEPHHVPTGEKSPTLAPQASNGSLGQAQTTEGELDTTPGPQASKEKDEALKAGSTHMLASVENANPDETLKEPEGDGGPTPANGGIHPALAPPDARPVPETDDKATTQILPVSVHSKIVENDASGPVFPSPYPNKLGGGSTASLAIKVDSATPSMNPRSPAFSSPGSSVHSPNRPTQQFASL